ncbi:MAG: tRNA 4-thiouridine(8) synthase ThiI, partial [Oscillospiraceae bacterium]|nr:tRNA 4-thiouridine(8) synthase ThiI [Oscillospiraceae bacterium]
VPFTDIQLAINKNCPLDYSTILMRVFMMQIANQVAARNKCEALITGECLAQVASQTLQALTVTDSTSSLPVLRPLIGMDKEEITKIARNIGTFETSILPYEDCCTVFTPKHPVTKPRMDKVQHSMGKLDVDGLIAEAIGEIETVRI